MRRRCRQCATQHERESLVSIDLTMTNVLPGVLATVGVEALAVGGTRDIARRAEWGIIQILREFFGLGSSRFLLAPRDQRHARTGGVGMTFASWRNTHPRK